jgi:hypothetical protein
LNQVPRIRGKLMLAYRRAARLCWNYSTRLSLMQHAPRRRQKGFWPGSTSTPTQPKQRWGDMLRCYSLEKKPASTCAEVASGNY